MMNFFDALHRGKAFGVFNNLGSAGVAPINLQLWNPTLIQDRTPISVYVHRVYVMSSVACFVSLAWWNTQLPNFVRQGTNLANEDFPTTSNASSVLFTTQQEANVAAKFFKSIRLPVGGGTFLFPEWVTKLPRGDSTQGGVSTGTGLLAQFSQIAAGETVGASFEWVEVNP